MNESIREKHQEELLKNCSGLSSPLTVAAGLNPAKRSLQGSSSSTPSKDLTSTNSSTSNYHDGIVSPEVPIGQPSSVYVSSDASRLHDLDLHGRSTDLPECTFAAEKIRNSQSSFPSTKSRTTYGPRKRAASPEERRKGGSPVRVQGKAFVGKELSQKLQKSGMAISNLDMDDARAVSAAKWRGAGMNTFHPKRQDHSSNTQTEHHNGSKQSKSVSNASACGMFLQPETHPITEDQLVNEVRGIYAGLVMVEKKCMEIDKQQSQSANKLNDLQWQALIALHRTLLHEHHDFFLASQHPSASPGLRRLAERYAMPARMWRYGIHSFLELLRHRLPGSLEHMLTFIYMAYSMMTLLLESVPAFEETWIECLGDLARYRMAVEEVDMRDREIWSGVARYWYNKAADKNPDVGRIQHHLAVLARPNIVQQLFYYTKSLVSVQPFPSAKESILLLFNPLLDRSRPDNDRYPAAIVAFVSSHATLFIKGRVVQYIEFVDRFLSLFDAHISRMGTLFREQGLYIVSSNYAAIMGYSQEGAILPPNFSEKKIKELTFHEAYEDAKESWNDPEGSSFPKAPSSEVDVDRTKLSNPSKIVSYASHLAFKSLKVILQRIGDKNILPSIHVSLAFLWCFALDPDSMVYIQEDVPWERIAAFLNTLIQNDTNIKVIESGEFPRSEDGTSQQLPEDFHIRGQAWSQRYYPNEFFTTSSLEDEERSIEFPSITAPRIHRCLWLGVRLATFNCWISYNSQRRNFSATPFAFQLESSAKGRSIIDQWSKTVSVQPVEEDTKMLDV